MFFDNYDDEEERDGEDPEDPAGPMDSEDPEDPAGTMDPRDPVYSLDETDEEYENFVNRTYVCEDCDFRWAEKIYPERNDYPDYDDELGRAHICPMCGSLNVSFY